MEVDFHKSIPIYLQLIDRMKWRIMKGEIQPGEKLPSVREIALEYNVNPNTVQRMYSEMGRMGMVEVLRGQGTFVTKNQERLEFLRQELKNEQIAQFVQTMTEAGFDGSEIISGLKEYLRRKSDGRTEERQ